MSDSISRLDKVAESICSAHTGDIDAWDITYDGGRDTYRRMAQAAIDALGLTQESRELADGAGGVSTNWKTGKTTSYAKPCTKVSRLVSPWQVDGGAA